DVENLGQVARQLAEDLFAFGARHRQRRATQRLLAALAVGDVGRDPAHGVGPPRSVDQRELVRQVDPPSLFRVDGFLEVDRVPRVDDAGVVAAQLRRRGGEHLGIELADDRADRNALDPLEFAVDEQETSVEILDEDRGGRVIDDLLQLRLRVQRARGHGRSSSVGHRAAWRGKRCREANAGRTWAARLLPSGYKRTNAVTRPPAGRTTTP